MILDGYFCPSIFVGGNNKIYQQIDELERLLHAYRTGLIKERR